MNRPSYLWWKYNRDRSCHKFMTDQYWHSQATQSINQLIFLYSHPPHWWLITAPHKSVALIWFELAGTHTASCCIVPASSNQSCNELNTARRLDAMFSFKYCRRKSGVEYRRLNNSDVWYRWIGYTTSVGVARVIDEHRSQFSELQYYDTNVRI